MDELSKCRNLFLAELAGLKAELSKDAAILRLARQRVHSCKSLLKLRYFIFSLKLSVMGRKI